MSSKTGRIRGTKDRPRRIRSLIRRDGLVCGFCGELIDLDAPPNTPGRLSIDHVVPYSQGGTNALTNLRLAHSGCNSAAGGELSRAKTLAR